MKKVLVAEDDKFLANAYRVKLEKAGFELKVAANGAEVLQIMQSFKPDIIVLDLVMPVKDGFETLAELKRHEDWKNIPVLVASNLGQKEDVDRATKLGAADYVIKSDMTMASLVEKINALSVQ